MAELSGIDNQIVLACEIPEGATPGSTFHVQLNDRFFEVVTPDDAVPGQTINIVVPSESTVSSSDVPKYPEQYETLIGMGFEPAAVTAALDAAGGDLEAASARLVGDVRTGTVVVPESPFAGLAGRLTTMAGLAVAHAKSIDEKYKITDKIVEVATPAIEKIKEVDETYKISQKTVAAGETAKAKLVEFDERYEISNKANAAIAAGTQKIRELDEQHRLTERARTAGESITTYAREIDGRYAVSATVARIVELGVEHIIAAFQRLKAMHSGGAASAATVEELPDESAPPTAAAVSSSSPEVVEAKAVIDSSKA